MKWRSDLPNSPGDWLWVEMYSCGCCVHQCGVLFFKEEDFDHFNKKEYYKDSEQLWDYVDKLNITAWTKIKLPPKKMTEKYYFNDIKKEE